MTGIGIFLACLAAYFGVGWRLAKWDMPRAWAGAIRENSSSYDGEVYEDMARQSVAFQTMGTIILWPVMIPFWRLLVPAIKGAVEQGDPRALQREIKARDERIAELEKELGLGR